MSSKTTSANKFVRSLSTSLLASLKRKVVFSNRCSRRIMMACCPKFNVFGVMKTNKSFSREHGKFMKMLTMNR
jgi:hypothetical protein